MWQTIVAVCGTLLGVLATGQVQRRADRAAEATARRRDQLAAVTALASALADHRRAMWVREELRLTGADADAVAAARAESHRTRSAVTAPHVTLAVLVPQLRAAADQAAHTAYALRAAPDLATLGTLRQASVAASDALVTAAGRELAGAVRPGRNRAGDVPAPSTSPS